MFDRKDGLPPASELTGSGTPAPTAAPTPTTTAPADTGWRLDKKEWNLLDGGLAKPGDGYFIGGKGEKGARWGTAGGGFTGSIHQEGLDIDAKPGDYDIHAKGDFKKKEGDIAFSQGGSQFMDLYGGGSGLKDYHLGLKNDYKIGGGTLTPSFQHEAVAGKGDEKLSLDYKGDKMLGSLAGTAYDRGGFGLNANGTYKLNDTDSISGTAGFSHVDGADKLNFGLTEKYGETTTKQGLNLQLGDKASVGNTFGVSNQTDSVNFGLNQGVAGDSTSLDASHKFAGGSSLNGGFSLAHDAKGAETDKITLGGSTPMAGGTGSANLGLTLGPNGKTTEDLDLKYGSKSDNFGLKIHEGGHNDQSLGLDYKHNFDADTALGGNFNLAQTDKGSTWKAGESFTSKRFAENLAIGGATDGSNLKGSAAGTLQLTPNLYAGAYGDINKDAKGMGYDAGGSLTYMASPNLGITAAGGYGSNGYEGRLEADFFKDKVNGAGSLQDARGKPMFDVYLGVSGGKGAGLGQQMGGTDWSTPLGGGGTGPAVTAGVGWKF